MKRIVTGMAIVCGAFVLCVLLSGCPAGGGSSSGGSGAKAWAMVQQNPAYAIPAAPLFSRQLG